MASRSKLRGNIAVAGAKMMIAAALACAGAFCQGQKPPAFKIEELPLLRKDIQTHQFCSYDRAGDNYDEQYFPLYVEANGEAVIFDAMGPGCLYRHHMNIWKPNPSPVDLHDLRIRYYFDGEATPRIDMDVSTFFSSKNPLGIFRPPNAVDGGEDFRVLYYPMCFKKRLKVALSREPRGQTTPNQTPWTGRYDKLPDRHNNWYEYTFHTFTDDWGIQSWMPGQDATATFASWDPRKLGQDPKSSEGNLVRDVSVPVPAAKRITLWESATAGSIQSLRFNLSPLSEETLFQTWLTISFDDQALPPVEAPLGAFFGANRKDVRSFFAGLLVGYSPTSMYAYFPMPFWRSVKIGVENRGGEDIAALNAHIEYTGSEANRYPEAESGYFFGRYHREFPRNEGHDYRYLQEEGSGQVVGHLVSRYDTSMEEDERTYFDGSRTPQIYGEGFEDDHDMGWGLKNLQYAVFGAIAADGGSGSVYRFFVPDLYYFHSEITHGHQVYGPHSPLGHEGMYQVGNEESVTFFYGRKEPVLALSDEFDVGKRQAERDHAYRVTGLTKRKKGRFWYDGEFNNVLFKTRPLQDDGVSFKGFSEFTVKIDPANRGIRIRRRTDKENNRQTANVYVDGAVVTERPWYSVDYEKTFRGIRWLDTDFEIPYKYTRGKNSVRLKIEYVSAKNHEWDEYHYWVYSYK